MDRLKQLEKALKEALLSKPTSKAKYENKIFIFSFSFCHNCVFFDLGCIFNNNRRLAV
jgi:hypothetical protein